MDQSEQPAPSEKSAREQDNVDNSSSSSDGEGLTSDKQDPSSGNSSDLSTEGGADITTSAETAVEPREHD